MKDDKKTENKKNPEVLRFEKKKQPGNWTKTALWAGSVIVFVFATIAFLLLPAALPSSGGEAPVFGYFGKKPISQTAQPYFVNMLQQYSEYTRQTNPGVDQTYSIFQQAFDATVMYLAYSQEVENSGYVVSEKKIDREMLPYFYDNRGVYSPKLFNDTPASRRISLRKDINTSLVSRRYYDDVFGSSTETVGGYKLYGRKEPSKEEAFFKKMGAVERSFELASFALSNFPPEEVEKFVRENPALFIKHDLSVITASTEEEARKIKSQLDKTEVTFEDAVKELSVKYYSGDDGKLTSSYQYQIKNIVTSDETLASVTALKSGESSGIIATVNGFSIFRCDGDLIFPDYSSSQLKSDSKNYMNLNERGRIEDYYINTARDFSVAAARDGFDAACEAFGISKVDVEAFPLNYGNNGLLDMTPSSSVPELSGAETNENFLKTAFSIGQNEISTPMVLGSNVVVIRLKEEINTQAASETAENAENSNDVTIDNGDGGLSTFSLSQYYITQFDQQSAQNAIMQDKRLKNNFSSVFFKYYLSGN
ncbi:MAG: peptidylprolyl isomerase [Treponema sp.]|jgi:hypothetical protein|nr:peptidylprolyl isomerase [Treponema sp.]